ncbi:MULTISPECIES: HTH-type transcriptional repressor FabR [Dyella]|uniref:HTH-type transcriptional repressor FabR n=2 Tax=Dyella TaxID=231454 RepID=A0A4R0YVH5_9GAMM|nr:MULTISPECIES: HTH-type transcriptional repressor FabR [Dyella]TBR39058.1 HTH-type transcriptional repressor FabR [Dyella terrae]TCI13352.1 HTH-type transcriptional repressor FabR [Dyella soli]
MPQTLAPYEAPEAGRKHQISRDDLLKAALRLLGPHRSVSSLGLREIAREADIAPNSFYRHFRDIDELAVALIELSGEALRRVVVQARTHVVSGNAVVRGSVEAFMSQMRSRDGLMQVLLREGTAGSDAFKQAVDRQLDFFEEELRVELERLSRAADQPLHDPAIAAKAITRLIFAMGAHALDQPVDHDAQLADQMTQMVTMILLGSRQLRTRQG